MVECSTMVKNNEESQKQAAVHVNSLFTLSNEAILHF